MRNNARYALMLFMLSFGILMFVLFVLISGCKGSSIFGDAASPTGPTPIPTPLSNSVTIAGGCVPLTAGIQCSDESSCFSSDENGMSTEVDCRDVLWSAESQVTGLPLRSKLGQPQSTVQFTAVPLGPYKVTQFVTHSDGISSASQDINVTVTK